MAQCDRGHTGWRRVAPKRVHGLERQGVKHSDGRLRRDNDELVVGLDGVHWCRDGQRVHQPVCESTNTHTHTHMAQ